MGSQQRQVASFKIPAYSEGSASHTLYFSGHIYRLGKPLRHFSKGKTDSPPPCNLLYIKTTQVHVPNIGFHMALWLVVGLWNSSKKVVGNEMLKVQSNGIKCVKRKECSFMRQHLKREVMHEPQIPVKSCKFYTILSFFVCQVSLWNSIHHWCVSWNHIITVIVQCMPQHKYTDLHQNQIHYRFWLT